MIKVKCFNCGHVWWAAVIMGENCCPNCNSENTYIAISVGNDLLEENPDQNLSGW